MLAKQSLPFTGAKTCIAKTICLHDLLCRLFKPLFEKRQMTIPSKEVRDAIRDREETVREISEMIRWSMFH